MEFTSHSVIRLSQKVKHLLLLSNGYNAEEASNESFYQAFASALKEEILIQWSATAKTLEDSQAKIAYFLSMEYLPGKMLQNNILNMNATELVAAVLKRLNRNLTDLIDVEPEPGLGNGGLGRLASCFLSSLASMQYPALGYGLRYQYGIFEQEIWDGTQVEKPDCWLMESDPWEKRRDHFSTLIRYGGRPVDGQNKHGALVQRIEEADEVRALPYDTPIIGYNPEHASSILTLRLWSTKESPRNFQLQRYNAGFLDQASENTSLTDVLYPNDNTEMGKRVRLKQEFLLVSASLKDILKRHLRIFGDLTQLKEKIHIQINDTHPALIIPEMVRLLTKSYDFSWEEAWETCQACCGYTNHSVLRESLEEWKESRMASLLPRQHKIIELLNQDFCNQVRQRFPNQEDKVRALSVIEGGQVKMAHLAILGSHKVNSVSKLHLDVLKTKIFPEFYEMFPDKFLAITNGVDPRRWISLANPELAAFISKLIGNEWMQDFSHIQKLADFADNPDIQDEFLRIKKQKKKQLIASLSRENPIRDPQGKIVAHFSTLFEDALFSVQIKRFHEYKRQLMNALHLIMIYQELLNNPKARKVKRLAIFGGKAAPGYVQAKHILSLVFSLARTFSRNPHISNSLQVVFVENYNVSKAEQIIPAADLSEQISIAGWEASGTSNMKFSMNGAMTIATQDGANLEMHQAVSDRWWPFAFGKSAEDNSLPYDPQTIYQSDMAIQKAVQALQDGLFANHEKEAGYFRELAHHLMYEDTFRVLQDLRSYFHTQKKAEALFATPNLWAQTALHNIAGMGIFSSDRAIQEYAEKVWALQPCPLDLNILKLVKEDYATQDSCFTESP